MNGLESHKLCGRMRGCRHGAQDPNGCYRMRRFGHSRIPHSALKLDPVHRCEQPAIIRTVGVDSATHTRTAGAWVRLWRNHVAVALWSE